MTSWNFFHRQSEEAAAKGQFLIIQNDADGAREAYKKAAEYEEQALELVSPDQIRTLGILAVSAASLNFKAARQSKAEVIALRYLSNDRLPTPHLNSLRRLVQHIWSGTRSTEIPPEFYPGQITVAVRGGEVVHGGAPLDLVLSKIQTLQSIYARSIEWALGMDFRSRGATPKIVHENFRPWVFSAPAGSYQFSLALKSDSQAQLFPLTIDPQSVTDRVLQIIDSIINLEDNDLVSFIPSDLYRSTFIKLARNLAPTGKSFDELKIIAENSSASIALSAQTRRIISSKIQSGDAGTPLGFETITGTLRAVHLDKDWLEITRQQGLVRVVGLRDTVDDVIGPMVNRTVRVQVSKKQYQRNLRFVDIELEE